MKSLKILVPLAFLLYLIVPMALLAQDTNEGLTLSEAISLVQAEYGSTVFIREVSYDAEDACWKFHLADNSEFCVDEMTGEFAFDDNSAELTPEATDHSPEDTNDDNGNDGQEDESGDDNGNDAVTQTPTISLEEAIAIALTIYPDGLVTDAELEDFEDNFLVWDIELEAGQSVDVDALTGDVLSFGYETNDDNSYSQDDSNDENEDVNDDNSGSNSSDDSNDDNSGNDSSDDSNDDNSDDNSGSNDQNDDDNSGSNDQNDDNGGDNSGSGSDDNSNNSNDD